jgi:hypothetical protein
VSKNTYLSVDLDFWNCYQENITPDFQFLFDKITQHNISYYICQDHREILRHTKQFPHFSTLINVDAHQDFSDLMSNELKINNLNCGTWVNFVPQRKNKDSQYLWVHPNGVEGGYYFYDPFKEPERVGWSKANKMSLLRKSLQDIDFNEICGIGFSMSYDYIEWGVINAIKMLHVFSGKTFMNPIKKMRESEADYFINERTYNGDFERLYEDKVFYRA